MVRAGRGERVLDVEGFVALVEQDGAAVLAYLARRSPSHAEDLLARVWLEGFAARQGFDPALGSARAWLFGVARNVLHRHWREQMARRDRDWVSVSQELVHDPWEEVDRRLDSAGLAGSLRVALADLADIDREMLLLVAWEELTPTEAASVVGVPPATARTRLHRARARMRAALATDEADLPPLPLIGGQR